MPTPWANAPKIDFDETLKRVLAVYKCFHKNMTEADERAVKETLLEVPHMSTAPVQFVKLVEEAVAKLSLEEKK